MCSDFAEKLAGCLEENVDYYGKNDENSKHDEDNNGQELGYQKPIIAAYILDDHSNVIAAGSREDMHMGDLGCVLQFKVSKDMRSATARAIYDTDHDGVLMFSRTILVPAIEQ